jgi:hypothetical protein
MMNETGSFDLDAHPSPSNSSTGSEGGHISRHGSSRNLSFWHGGGLVSQLRSNLIYRISIVAMILALIVIAYIVYKCGC